MGFNGADGVQRVIYTSPIKALSNQKYRELQVGLAATRPATLRMM